MFLDEIVAHKRREVAASMQVVPAAKLEALAAQRPPGRDLAGALRGDRIRLMAEIKRASPSKGPLRPDLDPVATARIYAGNGAAAISVLTETRYFQGSLETLATVRQGLAPEEQLPLLRKDFIFSPYQVLEARAFGADALLLIVAMLNEAELRDLLRFSHSLGLQCLVEVHDESEVERAVASEADVIGINNRDLRTFQVDLDTTRRLRPLVPPARVVMSESGIRDRTDVERLQEWGVDAMLVGETLVVASDVGARVREILGIPTTSR